MIVRQPRQRGEELRETKAIGFFTKITLKNQVDDLLDRFREYYEGKSKLTMTAISAGLMSC